jgi:hypothetical protein
MKIAETGPSGAQMMGRMIDGTLRRSTIPGILWLSLLMMAEAASAK